MEFVLVPVSEIRKKGVWHFQPYSQSLRKISAQLEQSPFPVVELGKLVTESKRGYARKGTFSTPEIPFITIRNLSPKGVDLTAVNYISEKEHQQLKDTQIQPGDVLVSMIAHHPKSVVYESDRPANISHNILKIRLKPDIDPNYLVSYLNSDIGKVLIESRTVGTAQPTISLNALMNVPVVLPPFAEQRRIVNEVQQLEQQSTQLITEAEKHRAKPRSQFGQLLEEGTS